jgi:hypothetical protein
MATLMIYPEVARVLRDLIDTMQSGEFDRGQLTLEDTRGLPIDIVIRAEEAQYE